MVRSKVIRIDGYMDVKYGNVILKGASIINVMKNNKKGNTHRFEYELPKMKSTSEEGKFMHSRLNGQKCIVGRFDKALVIDNNHIISYGDYVILDPNSNYLYPVSPSELNIMSDANVKVYDAIEMQ